MLQQKRIKQSQIERIELALEAVAAFSPLSIDVLVQPCAQPWRLLQWFSSAVIAISIGLIGYLLFALSWYFSVALGFILAALWFFSSVVFSLVPKPLCNVASRQWVESLNSQNLMAKGRLNCVIAVNCTPIQGCIRFSDTVQSQLTVSVLAPIEADFNRNLITEGPVEALIKSIEACAVLGLGLAPTASVPENRFMILKS